jgi:glycosyltransferase involved in cell wall biosynthesis
MRFTIVTPSFNQLDWLELCVASVADQQGVEFVEHIVQDAGTPGIEEFARRLGADFYRDGKKVFSAQCASWSPRRPVSSNLGSVDGEAEAVESGKVGKCESAKVEGEGKVNEWEGGKVGKCDGEKLNRGGYSLTIYSEKDAGMYDAVNRGLRRASGEICAYLNCDEQYLPGTLCWVAAFFGKAENVEVLFGDVITIGLNGEAICYRRVTLPNRWHVMVAHLPTFTAATFFRAQLIKKGLFFPDGWRDLGDAVWVIELRRRGVSCRLAKRFLSAFTYTGMNMNLLPNARAEKVRLAQSAPVAARILTVPLICLHRFSKLWVGAYHRENVTYEIWCAGNVDCRSRFTSSRLTWKWPSPQ